MMSRCYEMMWRCYELGYETVMLSLQRHEATQQAYEGLAALGMERATKGLAILGMKGAVEGPEVLRGDRGEGRMKYDDSLLHQMRRSIHF